MNGPSPDNRRRYCLITPCRDEVRFLERTVRSVGAQTVPPALHLIVDDGSTDGTGELADSFRDEFDFIEVTHRRDRGERSVGPGVIEAFYHGLRQIRLEDYDYICKLDGDLDLPPAYFETLMAMMEEDPLIGCLSGKPFYYKRGDASDPLVPEPCGDDICVGMAKFYRTKCFREIGGFVRAVMWDGIDCHTCRMLGWKSFSTDRPELRFVHLRPMGSSDRGILRGRFRWGAGQYFMGTGPVYLLASVMNQFRTRPFLLGGLAMAWGYLHAWLRQVPRHAYPGFRQHLRRYHRLVLTKGRKRAGELVLGDRAR